MLATWVMGWLKPTYSQIFFRKPYEMEELSGDRLVEELKKERRSELIEELMPVFVKSSKIEYPQGDVFLKFNASPLSQSKPLKKKKQ